MLKPTQPMSQDALEQVMRYARDFDSYIESVTYNIRWENEVAGAGARDEIVIDFRIDPAETFLIARELTPDGYERETVEDTDAAVTVRIYRPGKEV